MGIIRDDTGTQRGLRVTSENRASVESSVRQIEQHINQKYAKQFSLTFESIDPVGADDYFLYIKNTGVKNIHLSKFRFKSTVVGTVEVHHVTGTASFTSDIDVPKANRNLGSSNTLTATIKTDTDTTGLTNSNTLLRLTLSTANTDFVDNAPSHIIVPPGQAVAFLWDTSTGVLAGTVDAYEDQDIL